MIDSHFEPQPKEALRHEILAARRAIADRGRLSRLIVDRFLQAFPLTSAKRPLVYVSVRDEVETDSLLENALATSGEVVVPYCLSNCQLGLFPLREMSELKKGAYGIREPAPELRAERSVDPESIDILVAPGVAFDLAGNRLGYGKGYFDRLLVRLRPDCVKVAFAFEGQLVERISAQSHDIPVEYIVTEKRTIDCGQYR
ncbi:5-formyltetrahydrofolate cyclo-ligase [Blastopirellula marina]|uniref:5-formyltetrahydrofolate cyclo-ligase n=1 Tax=Blastopirellula marina TaxID=124 RepID=A0A2S8FMV3_9BACT|nr:5-formyltetrahydrofolate cyclo-ligase [Blastopirellula marina]PQO33529.1 5-formyltetrahydrofolate cyclo-ligase [Blastopirellula marina]PTL43316.1 5-formyltetrahydrofolate cyclo-ligase [Blastopirellula marina]